MDLGFNTQSCARMIDCIEGMLQKDAISPQKGEQLQYVLHDMQLFLTDEASKINQFALPRLEELNEHIIELYGKIDTGVLNYKIQQIELEAEHLETVQGAVALASAVDALRAHIKSLFQSYAPALDQRRVLAILLEKADRLLQGKETQDLSQMIYMAEEVLKEEDRGYARFLFRQLPRDFKKFFHYYLGNIEETVDDLHEITHPTNMLPLSQSQGQHLFNTFAFRQSTK
jgi:hypothetical protein